MYQGISEKEKEMYSYFNLSDDELCEIELELDRIAKTTVEKDRKRGERRKTDWAKATRKMRMAVELYGEPVYKASHAHADGKIHCSCPLCAAKTNGKHISRHQGGSFDRLGKNWKPSDVKKIERDRSKKCEYLLTCG